MVSVEYDGDDVSRATETGTLFKLNWQSVRERYNDDNVGAKPRYSMHTLFRHGTARSGTIRGRSYAATCWKINPGRRPCPTIDIAFPLESKDFPLTQTSQPPSVRAAFRRLGPIMQAIAAAAGRSSTGSYSE
jgi:hypothetical protein